MLAVILVIVGIITGGTGWFIAAGVVVGIEVLAYAGMVVAANV
jgi:hypothetical protein